MRNPINVACGILEHIPSEYTQFILEINDYLTQLHFVAPEMLGQSQKHWHDFSNILNKYITQDDYNTIPWCKTVIDIFTDPNYNFINNNIGDA
jgi:hypothetical protein